MLRRYVDLVRSNRNYRRLWLAQIISEIGDWFYALSIYSLILELSGEARLLGIVVVLQVLPSTFIGPIAGVINDRLSRKKVMIASDLLRAIIVLGMLLVRTRGMIWLAFMLLLLETLLWAMFEPAKNAAIPNITTETEMITANTLSATTWSFNLAVGSALGGVAAVLLGRDAVFVINAASFVVSALLIRGMRFEEPHLKSAPPLAASLFPIVEGVRYIRRDARLLATVFVKSGIGFMGANLVLLPIFGERIFPIGSMDRGRGTMLSMSMLMAARGAGALIGPFVSGHLARGEEPRMRWGILFSFLTSACGYVLLGFAPSIWAAMAAVALAHAGGSTSWLFSTTLLQLNTEDEFRGRVFSADLGFCMLTYAISSYAAGIAIDSGVTPRHFATGMGLGMIVPSLVWRLALRLWKKDS